LDKLYFKYPDGLKNYALCLVSSSPELIEKFKDLCYHNLARELNWFHQSDHKNFQMFEFWSTNKNAIYEECKRIASLMDMDLEVQ
jgi:hypothetical protein